MITQKKQTKTTTLVQVGFLTWASFFGPSISKVLGPEPREGRESLLNDARRKTMPSP